MGGPRTMRWAAALAGAMVALLLADPSAGQAPPEATAGELLAQCPCEPRDKERFVTDVYPTASPEVPAPDPGFSQEERAAYVTARLQDRLQQRSAAERQRGLAVFDEARLETDVRLAAGLAMLVGTVGEAAIPLVLDENVFEDGVSFASAAVFEQIGLEGALGASIHQDGRDRIIVHERFQHEDFVMFAPTLVHEALHQDVLGSRPEEGAAHLLENFVAAELLRTYPDIADDKTELSRETLTDQLALIFNSETVLTSRGELFPGGVHADSWYEDAPFLRGLPDSPTPGSQLLVDILAALGQSFQTIPSYSVDLLASLDVDEIIDSPSATLSFEADELPTIAQALTVPFTLPAQVTSSTSRTLGRQASVPTEPTSVPEATLASTTDSTPTSVVSLTTAAPSSSVVTLNQPQRQDTLARTGNAVERDMQAALALVLFGTALVLGARPWRARKRSLD